MAGKKMEWVFAMYDRMSGPANRATRAMDNLSKSLRDVQRNSGASAGSTARSGGGVFGAMSTGLSWVAAAAAVATGAVSALASGASAGIRETVDLVRFQQDSMTVLETMLGSATAARTEFQRSLDIADASPLDTRDVLSMRQRLTTSGFTDNRERDVMSAALSDVASLRGMDSANHALLGFSQMRAMGSMGMQDFGQIREATGINQRQTFLSIARSRGMQGTEDAQVRAVSQLISRRQITADEGIRASLEAMSQQFGGGPLGTITERLGSTITGRLSTVRSAITTLLMSVDLTRIPGVQAFSRALENVGRLLSRANPLAGKLRDALTNLIDRGFSALFEPLGGAGGQAMLESAMLTVVSGIERVGTGIEYATPLVKAFFKGFGEGAAPTLRLLSSLSGGLAQGTPSTDLISRMQTFGDLLGRVVTVASTLGAVLWAVGTAIRDGILGPLGAVFGQIPPLLEAVSGLISGDLGFSEFGMRVVQGFINGFSGAANALINAVAGVMTSVVGIASAVLGIASPSRVFMGLGEYSAEGFALGIEGGTGDAQNAMSNMMAAPGAGALGGLGAGGGGPISIQIIVDGSSSPQETAEAVASKLAELFEGLSPEV